MPTRRSQSRARSISSVSRAPASCDARPCVRTRDEHVLQDRHPREDPAQLEAAADPGARDPVRCLAGDVGSAVGDRPGVGLDHAGDAVEERRLARAVGADQRVDLAVRGTSRSRRRRAVTPPNGLAQPDGREALAGGDVGRHRWASSFSVGGVERGSGRRARLGLVARRAARRRVISRIELRCGSNRSTSRVHGRDDPVGHEQHDHGEEQARWRPGGTGVSPNSSLKYSRALPTMTAPSSGPNSWRTPPSSAISTMYEPDQDRELEHRVEVAEPEGVHAAAERGEERRDDEDDELVRERRDAERLRLVLVLADRLEADAEARAVDQPPREQRDRQQAREQVEERAVVLRAEQVRERARDDEPVGAAGERRPALEDQQQDQDQGDRDDDERRAAYPQRGAADRDRERRRRRAPATNQATKLGSPAR